MKVAIVTGGSSGIGAATAIELSKRGWRVAVNYSRDIEKAKQIVGMCNDALAVQGDVAKDEDCRRIASEVMAKWGRIDALVNNAGTTKYVKHPDLDGLSAQDFERIFALNTIGPFQMSRACAAALKASNGAIVNVSSVAAIKGSGSSVAYAASKAALNSMTLSLARSLAPQVRVNTVCPGHVKTPWHDKQGAEAAARTEQKFAAAAPLKRSAEPQDVADAIVWLVEGARCVTGELLMVDCGIHLALPG